MEDVPVDLSFVSDLLGAISEDVLAENLDGSLVTDDFVPFTSLRREDSMTRLEDSWIWVLDRLDPGAGQSGQYSTRRDGRGANSNSLYMVLVSFSPDDCFVLYVFSGNDCLLNDGLEVSRLDVHCVGRVDQVSHIGLLKQISTELIQCFPLGPPLLCADNDGLDLLLPQSLQLWRVEVAVVRILALLLAVVQPRKTGKGVLVALRRLGVGRVRRAPDGQVGEVRSDELLWSEVTSSSDSSLIDKRDSGNRGPGTIVVVE